MHLDLTTLDKATTYRLLTHTVTPRPIAWVLTENGDADGDGYNLAPFSYFNIISSDPALLMIAVGHKRDGSQKDTWINIERSGHCVIHLADAAHVDAVNESARSLPHGESELNRLDVTLTPQVDFPLPYIESTPVSFNCKLHDIHLLGNGPQAVIYLQVLSAQVRDELIDAATLTVDTQQVNPLARLGGDDYALLGDILTRKRP